MTPEVPKKTVLDMPSLNPFSEDFAIKEDSEKEKQKKLSAVVYPTQVVIPKNKRKGSTIAAESTAPSEGAVEE
jgi:hypothetical protein